MFPRLMRFFEYAARELVTRAGIPVTDYGFATTPAEAREIAVRIGEPVVIKSQVLTGGRMKAGGVQFADTPDEAGEKAAHVLALEINGHMPRGVLVDPRASVMSRSTNSRASAVRIGTSRLSWRPVTPTEAMTSLAW